MDSPEEKNQSINDSSSASSVSAHDCTKDLTRLERINCFNEVKDMLESGVSVTEVTRFIRERGECLDISEKSLKNTVYRHLQRENKKLLRQQVPVPHLSLYSKDIERVSVADALNLVFAIQLDRILIDVQLEKQLNKCVGSTSQSIRIASEILGKLLDAEAAERTSGKASTGNVENVIEQTQKLREIFVAKFGQDDAELALHPEKRRRIINVLEKVRRGDNKDLLAAIAKKKEDLGIVEGAQDLNSSN